MMTRPFARLRRFERERPLGSLKCSFVTFEIISTRILVVNLELYPGYFTGNTGVKVSFDDDDSGAA